MLRRDFGRNRVRPKQWALRALQLAFFGPNAFRAARFVKSFAIRQRRFLGRFRPKKNKSIKVYVNLGPYVLTLSRFSYLNIVLLSNEEWK